MKLHRLHFENLASLYGEHEIDFDTQLNAPIFLVKGPTGVGKSTVFDAFCLALFGETPRLSKNVVAEILSRGTGYCLAEAVFSQLDQHDVRHFYRARWSVARARRKPEGNVQAPRRALFRLDTLHQELETLCDTAKVSEAQAVFAEALGGLRLSDFVRSVLLPQGEFAAFVSSKENERAELLGRLTQTEYFRDIGREAARLHREAKDKHEAIQVQLDRQQVLSQEQVETLQEGLRSGQASLRELDATLLSTQQRLDYRQQQRSFENDLELAKSKLEHALAARLQHASSLDTLRQAELRAPAIRLLFEYDRVTASAARCSAALEAEQGAREERRQRLQSASLSSAEARLLVDERRLESEQLSPKIAEAKAARLILAGLRASLAEKQRAELQQGGVVRAAQLGVKSAEQTLARRRLELEQCEQSLAKLGELGPLVQRKEKLQALRDRSHKALAVRSRLAAERAKAEPKRDALQAKVAEAQVRAAALAEQSEQLRAQQQFVREALAERLGVPVAQLDDAADAAQESYGLQLQQSRERLLVLSQLERFEKERLALQRELDGVIREQGEGETRLQALRALAAGWEAKRVEVSAKQAAQLAQLEILRLAQRFELEREKLASGKPCPVCGSLEHPYVEQSVALDAAQLVAAQEGARALRAELEQLEKEERACFQQLAQVEASLSALQARLERVSGRQQALLEEAQRSVGGEHESAQSLDARLLGLLSARLRETGAAVRKQELLAALAEVREAETERQASVEEARERLLQDQRAERTRQRELEELAQARERQAAADAVFSGQLVEAQQAVQQLEQQDQAVSAELQVLLEQLADELRALPGQEGLSLEAEPLLQRCEAAFVSMQRWQQAQEAQVLAAAAVEQAKQALVESEQKRAQAASALQLVQEAVEKERLAEVAALEREQAILGGLEPEREEERLRAAIAAAEQAWEEASALAQRLQEETAALEARIEMASQQLTQLRGSQSTLAAELQQALSALELDAEALRASALSEERLEELRALRQELDGLEQRTRGGLELARERLEQHLQRGLEDDDETESAESLSQRLQAGQAQRDGLIAELGDKAQQLKRHEQQLAEHAELELQRRDAADQLAAWEEVHRLIGVNNGESFHRFAQTVALGALLEGENGANAWLARFSRRYSLVQNKENEEPLLSFSICDHELADSLRPSETLSGGELFLVSLSLALAMASWRRHYYPVETLLLDEGFSSLDNLTMAEALDALMTVQRTGTQIGLISHVDALAEVVPCQLVIDAVGNGRSVIRNKERGTRNEGM